MNVLFLDQFSQMGGAQQGLLDTIDAARARGWRIWGALPAGPLIGQFESRGASVVEIPCGPYRSGTKSPADALRFVSDVRCQVRRLDRLLSRYSFDLIYVNGPRLLPAVALCSASRAPVLFHCHNHVEQTAARELAGWSIRRCKAAVAGCSHSVVDQFRHCAQNKHFVIPNGIRELPFRDREFPSHPKWRIGIIGRISPEKGQDDFMRAAALLNRDCPELEFVICGAPMFGDARYFDHVRRLARGLPVEFLGWREDITAVLSELDLLAVPSKLEGMGRVIIEAYSAGVPVVAYAVGGIPEVVTDRETGFLVTDQTPGGLAECIRQAMYAPAELHRITINARRAWEARYRLEIYQDRITELMERLASGHAAESETEAPLLHK